MSGWSALVLKLTSGNNSEQYCTTFWTGDINYLPTHNYLGLNGSTVKEI